MAHPWDMMAMSPCPPRLRWSPGVCEWSSRALRSILAHAATAPMSARAGRLPSPWAEMQKAHERAQPPAHAARTSATLLLGFRCRCRCVEAGRITYLLQVLCLPCLFLSLFRTLLLRGTVVIGHRLAPLSLSVCLSVSQACFHSRVCLASPLSSVFCAAQLHARAHRSGIFRPSSVSSLAVPVDQQPGKLPPSCSNCRLLSELLL